MVHLSHANVIWYISYNKSGFKMVGKIKLDAALSFMCLWQTRWDDKNIHVGVSTLATLKHTQYETTAPERLNISSSTTNIKSMSENYPCRKFHITLRSLAVLTTNRYTVSENVQSRQITGQSTGSKYTWSLFVLSITLRLYILAQFKNKQKHVFWIFEAKLNFSILAFPSLCEKVKKELCKAERSG